MRRQKILSSFNLHSLIPRIAKQVPVCYTEKDFYTGQVQAGTEMEMTEMKPVNEFDKMSENTALRQSAAENRRNEE